MEVDMVDFAVIRDARTGRHAKVPKDPKLRAVVALGSQDTLEDKTVTVSSGSDFVNVSFINFCCTRKDIALVSANFIFLGRSRSCWATVHNRPGVQYMTPRVHNKSRRQYMMSPGYCP